MKNNNILALINLFEALRNAINGKNVLYTYKNRNIDIELIKKYIDTINPKVSYVSDIENNFILFTNNGGKIEFYRG